jgi:tyrosine phenol-lyase
MSPRVPQHEPYKIKTVRRVPFPTPGERRNNLIEAHFNVLRLRPSQVTFDMLAWHGQRRESGAARGQLQVGDEAYAGARNFEALERAVREVLGPRPTCARPTTCWAAVKLLVATMVPEGRRRGERTA